MRIIIFVALIAVATGASVLLALSDDDRGARPPQPKVAEQPLYLRNAMAEYIEYIGQSMRDAGIPGAAIAIVKDTATVYMRGFGVRDIRTGFPVDERTVFRLASISKPITASLVAALVEDGALSWDDTVSGNWKRFSSPQGNNGNILRVRNLLSHTTGFPYHAYTDLVERGDSFASMAVELETLDPVSSVGAMYSYQNVAFSLIGKVILSAVHVPFDEAMRRRLIAPLRLYDMSMSYDALLGAANAAMPHVWRRRQWEPVPVSPKYYNVAPAGGFNASVSDMSKWMKAMLGHANRVVAASSIERLLEPVIETDPKNNHFNRWRKIRKSYYGLGWRILRFDEDVTIVYHGGFVEGYRSEVALYPKEGLGICALFNGAGALPNQAIPTFLSIYDRCKSEFANETSDSATSRPNLPLAQILHPAAPRRGI